MSLTKLLPIQAILVQAMLYCLRLILPLLVLPILTRTILPNDFGIYLSIVSVSIWVSLIIDYGFSIASTRSIAKGDPVLAILCQTQSAKVILVIVTAPIFISLLFYLPIFDNYRLWGLAGWLAGVLSAMTPTYYFQGIEKLRLVGLVEAISSVSFLFLVNFLIVAPSDSRLLPILFVVTKLISTTVLTKAMTVDSGYSVWNFSLESGLQQLKKDFSFFLFQIAIGAYTSFNVIFLGLFCTPTQVGSYAAAERLIRAGIGFLGQISIAIFPRLNSLRSQNPQRLSNARVVVGLGLVVLGFLGLVFTLSFSKHISELLYGSISASVSEILDNMALLIPAIAISNTFGYHFLLVDRHETIFNKIVVFFAVANFPFAYMLVHQFGVKGMAYSWILIEWLIAIALTVAVFFKREGTR